MSKTATKTSEKSQKLDSLISDELKRIEELENLLEESLQKKAELEEKFSEEKKVLEEKNMRISADLQNIKRRSDSDKQKARIDGAVRTLSPFIEVIDNFSRAFDHLPEDLKGNEFISGLQGIEKKFSETLEGLQVQFFGVVGDGFDANLHESLMVSPEAKAGEIAQVFEQGVRLGNTVIRHAKVSVGA